MNSLPILSRWACTFAGGFHASISPLARRMYPCTGCGNGLITSQPLWIV